MKIRSSVQKLKQLEKCQFSNCSHLIASHCIGLVLDEGTLSWSMCLEADLPSMASLDCRSPLSFNLNSGNAQTRK